MSGCKNVFLDVGSNRGTHVRKLFEPSKYSSAKYLKVFEKSFGKYHFLPYNETGLCAFGFEANPRWVPRLLAIEKAYTQMGWRVKFFAPSVVSNEAGKAKFWINDDGKDSDWGASEFKDKKAHKSKEIKVPKLDMPLFMKKVAYHSPDGYKLMKMDIEGGEYTVLPPLLEQGLLCEDTLNTITIEWHRDPGVATLGSLDAVRVFEAQVQNKSRCLPKASTEFLSFDDESFRDDGVPIPGFEDDVDMNPGGNGYHHKGGGHAGKGTNCRGKDCGVLEEQAPESAVESAFESVESAAESAPESDPESAPDSASSFNNIDNAHAIKALGSMALKALGFKA